ncbi:arginine--tRNA ligase [Pokkaliibacter plantistimulans]|uniref:Arginine--tRNA ligase n=1 Tax=Pokkaliibacter plantistimulans TaxID=1635171 RepID=A0ABX5LZK9_9GAMM|nr:arginine--tRNA ligase [Pokkaliibacter plantistimulans]PXF32111.1 arginine--tRNA ligase [Pokkaliibacter plantistimulans]
MKELIANLIHTALDSLKAAGTLPVELDVQAQVDATRDKTHGDFASNIAMVLSKQARRNPRELAQAIIAALPADAAITKVEIAGPGFINFFVSSASTAEVIPSIIAAGSAFGLSQLGKGEKVQVEFVSANPTGPLHVGHGRGAAYGATLSNLMAAVGYDIQREYYVNDAGRQMNILAASVWLRYLELCGEEFTFPSNGYKGDYIRDYAAELLQRVEQAYRHPATTVFDGVPADEPAGGDKEIHIDALIDKARDLLGEDAYEVVFQLGLTRILDDIRDDLGEFGVTFNEWFSERSLTENVERAIQTLIDNGHIYEQEGALWFRSTTFGDDKDRVVKRDNGQTTYFASDIAYLQNKFERGFDRVIYVWGADHHGYIPRMKAACEALGFDPERIQIRLVQFAILYRGGERVQMSTRSGSFVTLRELRDEVGNDAARFFYVSRKAEQHMDFDLDLAKSESKDNPVYYIQYAHARICTLLQKVAAEETAFDQARGLNNLSLLEQEAEKDLMQKLARYPEALENAAVNGDPHILAHYLRELAGDFHTYYNAHRMLLEDVNLRDARLVLSQAVRQVVANGLSLLGVSAPESM